MRWRTLGCQLTIQGYPPHYGAAVLSVIPADARLIQAVSAVHNWAVLALVTYSVHLSAAVVDHPIPLLV